ncbi:DUF4439 domain-containing protein [Cellulomonas pakistanensis]|uniref:DUF4439 domain-containing protein n=1 Tax=Cellulomonas pakistanensis TaxID=992287 RepID=A0A919U4U6_9CELL|nr:DUF4439 domain-containing protein [Cellulomonas pakistanensis]GIG37856.1 hypothetical protein Cpa01nite_32370 [Cellulomonas pakistanensis]
MPSTAAPSARPASRSPRTRAVGAVLAVAAAVLLSGCGLRWETEPPAEPVPDAAEQVRRDAVADALALADAADAAGAGADAGVAELLGLVASTAGVQADALGGVYDSGIAPAEGEDPTPSPTPTATTSATPAEVLGLLGEAASAARADARAAEDPGMARLLASVAASRAQLADRLAAALGTEPPAVDAEPEGGFTAGGSADGSGSGDGSAEAPSASSPASPTPAATAPADAVATDLDRGDVLALVLAEDQAGYGFEVAAARLSGDARTLARSAAGAHRSAASAWAEAAGVAGTAEDPRRVAYDLDGDVSSAEAVRTFAAGLLTDLASVHADALLATGAGTADRTAVVDGLRTSAVETLAWGATPTALPGLPDPAPLATPTPTPTAG